jgi:hypothetical protein
MSSNIIYNSYVYLWYDTRAKLFYVGGHKGTVEDSYICSSVMMLRAYKKRPESFKFRVLEYIKGSNDDLRKAEQKWLDLIKEEELYWTPNIYNKTVRYYNQKKNSSGGNGKSNKGKRKIVPAWNKGMTKNEMLNYKKIRPVVQKPKTKELKTKEPKISKKNSCRVYFYKCEKCNNDFCSRKIERRFCSTTCRSRNNASMVKENGMKKIHVRERYSKLVTGRKRQYRQDDSWFWYYPNKADPLFDRVESIPQT